MNKPQTGDELHAKENISAPLSAEYKVIMGNNIEGPKLAHDWDIVYEPPPEQNTRSLRNEDWASPPDSLTVELQNDNNSFVYLVASNFGQWQLITTQVLRACY